MATRTELSLPGARLVAFEHSDHSATLTLDPCHVYVALTGSREETEWRQAARIVVEGVNQEAPFAAECELEGGDVSAAGFTYRDRIPLPLDEQGQVAVSLRCGQQDDGVRIEGERLRIELFGERKYVRHVR